MEEVSVRALADADEALYLKAFIVPKQEAEITVAALKKYARGRLPKYMVPEVFEVCGSLPKTSTGKIDRQKLQSLNQIAAAE